MEKTQLIYIANVVKSGRPSLIVTWENTTSETGGQGKKLKTESLTVIPRESMGQHFCFWKIFFFRNILNASIHQNIYINFGFVSEEKRN